MPYGIDKKLGGDTKENDSWMERCVSKVEANLPASRKDKHGSAIAICKAQMKKSKKAGFIYEEDIFVEPEVVASFESFREQWIKKTMNTGKSFIESNELFNSYLALNNYNF